ncbi:MAG: hypothetical protein LBS96_10000 [Oscillospiraceae bacterium]|nr:hypothetical protein [Oscillospiraceae bacterium]
MKKLLSILLALCLLFGMVFVAAVPAAAAAGEITVVLSYLADESGFWIAPAEFTVSPGLAEKYGYTDSFGGTQVSALDAIVAAHEFVFADALTDYLTVSGSGMISNFMGDGAGNFVYLVNGELASVGAGSQALSDADTFALFALQDTDMWSDAYAWFAVDGSKVTQLVADVDEEITLTLECIPAIGWGSDRVYEAYDAQIVPVELTAGAGLFGAPLATTDDDGEAVISFDAPGTYYISATTGEYDFPVMSPWLVVTIPDWEQALADVQTYLATTLTAPTFGTEWVVLALARSGAAVPAGYYEGYYASVKDTLQKNNGVLPGSGTRKTEYSRLILALSALGADVTDVAGYNLLTPLTVFNDVIAQGVNGAIYALLALDSNRWELPASSQTTRQKLVDYIVGEALPTGGFTWWDGLDVDLTGMALQALAPYASQPAVQTVIDASLTALSAAQLANGSYDSWGSESPEAVAQVVVALAALGIPAATDARFNQASGNLLSALLAFQLANGGFKPGFEAAANAMTTEQAAYALAAYARFKSGENALFDMRDAPALLTEEPVEQPPELTPLQKWEAKLPAWLHGIIALQDWFEWVIYYVFFGWIWDVI